MTKVLARLFVSGTEGDDSYVSHYRNGVFGGGSNIAFETVETLAVAFKKGRTHLLSCRRSCCFSLGSDPFYVTPQTVEPVISRNLLGHRGIA